MSTVEIEPRLPEGRVKEWRRRHDSTVKTLTESHEPATQVVVKKRAEPKPESKEKSGKNVLRRAWDAIPAPVKYVGAALLGAFLIQGLFKGMRDMHADMGKRTHEAGRGIANAGRAPSVTTGITQGNNAVTGAGDGAIDRRPIGGTQYSER